MNSRTDHQINKGNINLYIPASWERLITLVKHQALSAGHSIIRAEFGAGKSTCIDIIEKKLRLNEQFSVTTFNVTPLTTSDEVTAITQIPNNKAKVILVDDAHDASEELLNAILQDKTCSWLLFGEPLLSQRLSSVSQVFKLPAFQPDDCHEFLVKQLENVKGFTEVSRLKSDHYYDQSLGNPAQLIKLANQDMSDLLQSDTSLEHFESSSSGWFSSIVLGLGIVVFIAVLLFKFLNKDDKEHKEQIQPESIAFIDKSSEEVFDSPSESISTFETAEQKVAVTPVEVKKALPAQDLALVEWAKQFPKDHHTLQLFSHQERAEAESFLDNLDLADSFIVVSHVNDSERFRVIWGAYATRAEAELSKQSLPSKILEQKPWIRPLSALLEEN